MISQLSNTGITGMYFEAYRVAHLSTPKLVPFEFSTDALRPFAKETGLGPWVELLGGTPPSVLRVFWLFPLEPTPIIRGELVPDDIPELLLLPPPPASIIARAAGFIGAMPLPPGAGDCDVCCGAPGPYKS